MRYEELTIEGRNAILEAFRSGKTIDRLFVLDGCQDGPVRTIVKEAKKRDTIINFVARERLDQMSGTGNTRAWWPIWPPMSTHRWRICWPWRRARGSRRF